MVPPRVLFAPRELPLLGPDAAADVPRYRLWLEERRRDRLQSRDVALEGPTGVRPTITFLVGVPARERSMLRRTERTLLRQIDSSWRLSIALFGTSQKGRPTAWGLPGQHRLPWVGGGRSTVRRFDPAVGTATALGHLLDDVTTDAVALLDAGDQLETDAVLLLANALTEGDVAYADEDDLASDGSGPFEPRLKPAWSPEMLLSMPYLGRPCAIRTDVLRNAGGFRSSAGDEWEHDVMLRVTERTSRVIHVPEVLYHRRTTRGPVRAGSAPIRRTDTAGSAVPDALARRGELATVEGGLAPGTVRIHRRASRPVSVSAIIPFRDQPGFLRACMDSLTATVTPRGPVEFDVVLVDNGSTDPETRTLMARYAARADVTVLQDARPFNWAQLNNAAARQSSGDVLLFLNNDIEAIRPGWVEALAAQALRPDVGAAGARLLYADRRLQHAGVVIGLGGAAGHVLAGLPADQPGYLAMAVVARECTAVTGACLATRRSVFEEMDGFDEALGLDLNDIDYCLRAGDRGYRILFEPAAELLHRESPTRGTSGSIPDITRFVDRWEGSIRAGDPYLNPHLSRVDSSCQLRVGDEERWWQEWRSTLSRS